MINFTAKTNQKNQDKLNALANKTINWLNIEKAEVKISIVPASELKSLQGVCSFDLEIKVANRNNYSEMAHALIHELVHAEQIENLMLEEINGVEYFNGSELKGNAPCIEANKIADTLLREWS